MGYVCGDVCSCAISGDVCMHVRPEKPGVRYLMISIWKDGSRPWRVRTSERPLGVEASHDSGIRDPHLKSRMSNFMRVDRSARVCVCVCVYVCIYIYIYYIYICLHHVYVTNIICCYRCYGCVCV